MKLIILPPPHTHFTDSCCDSSYSMLVIGSPRMYSTHGNHTDSSTQMISTIEEPQDLVTSHR